jgi:hypothetical protein
VGNVPREKLNTDALRRMKEKRPVLPSALDVSVLL